MKRDDPSNGHSTSLGEQYIHLVYILEQTTAASIKLPHYAHITAHVGCRARAVSQIDNSHGDERLKV